MTRTSRRAWRRISLVAFATLAIVASSLPLAPISSAAGNQALLMDGVNDGVLLGPFGTPSPLGAQVFTLELWFMRTGAGAAASTGTGGNTDSIPLITKGRSESDGTNVDTNYFLGIDASSGELEADFEDQRASNNNNPVNGATPVTQNVWHHAAVTYSGTQFCLYLDGNLDGTCTATTQTPRSDSIQSPAIGTASDSTGVLAGFFAGRVDEVRIWNVARTQQQIQGSMNSELTSGTGLIGRWGVNDGAGTSVAGSVGGINGTTTGGPTWVSGAPALDPPAAGNQALLLDGVNDGVLLGPFGTPSPLGAQVFTLELWFMRTGAGAAASTGTGGNTDSIPLITKGRSESDGTNVDTNYFLGIDASSGELEADFEDQRASNNNNPVNGATPVTQNVWHHAAVTYSGTQFCLYLDGNLDGTCTATTQTPRSDSIQSPAIGTASDSTGVLAGFFAGRVDEVRIWNVARTQQQIQGSMNSELTSGTGLIGRWGVNDGAGTSVAGSVGGINGTTTGGPTWVSGAPALDGPPPSGNTGLQFNGSSQHVTFGAAPGLGASTFTIETWFKRTGSGIGTDTGSGGIASAVPLVTKGRAESDNSNVDMNYFLGIDTSNNRLIVDYEEGAGQTQPGLNHPLTGNTDVTSNVWHHAAATFDGTTLRIYLDGVINGTLNVGSNRAPRSDSIQHAALATAMNSTGVASGFFAGVLDESRIWNVARTDTQIANSMNSELTSGTGLIGRWGMNEGAGSSVGGSVGGINGSTVGGPTWVPGAPFSVGAAPNAPTLVAPADNATGISTSPTLDVTVSDPDTDPLDVTFYGRAINGQPGPNFTIVAIPDTQHYSEQAPLTPIYNAQMQWIVDSADDLNTVFATHLGDIVENAGNQTEWTRADAAQDILDNNGVKNAVLPGNHDMNTSTGVATNYDTYFPPSRYQGNPWYGGYLGSSPSDPVNRLNKDNYQLFSAGGMDFLIISLEHDMPAYSVNWAQGIINAFPSRHVIISTHAFVNQNNVRPTSPYDRPDGMSAQAVWQQLISPNCNIFMVVNGHYHGEGRRTDPNSCGQPVFQLNSDYQDDPNGGDGWLRYYTFKPSENKIYAYTFSPTRNNGAGDFETDADSQFVMDWTMSGSGQFAQIGTVQDVPSGQHATLQWNGLNGATEYEWYADVSDSSHTVTGPTWSFTTEVPPPAPPVVDSVTINQLSPRTADTLSVTVTSHDPNNDPVTYAYQWIKNGTAISGANSANLNLATTGNGDRGDQISVQVIANDGTANSAPVTSSAVTILNTIPTATVSLSTTAPGTNQTLTATATRTDPDETPTLNYVWKVNGTIRKQTNASSSLTDSFDLSQAGNGDVGDVITVEVTPNDGTASGTTVTATATVSNTLMSLTPDSTYGTNGRVLAILRVGGAVYIGGDFTELVGHNGEIVPRQNVAALDANTGNPLPWNPGADGTVLALAASPNGQMIYLGGSFRHIGPATRERIAAVDATTGALSAWNPAVASTVRALATFGDLVFVGGTFITITGAQNQGPVSRTRIGAISATTGRVDLNWVASASATPLNMLVTPDNRLIVVGNFTQMNGTAAGRIAALDVATGARLPWQGSINAGTNGLTQGPGQIFVGSGVGAGGNQVIAFNITTGAQQWVTTGDGDVLAVAFRDGVVYAGGHFATMAGQARSRLAALNANNGSLRADWTASIADPNEVDVMQASGNRLYVGGGFPQVSGQNQRNYAVFSDNSGNTSPVVDTVSINQTNPRTGDNLSVTVTSHDNDNDPVTYAYQWTKNGNDIAGATSSTLDLSQTGNGDRGDAIRVRVTAYDGTTTSAAVTSAPVTVGNTAPTATVSLDNPSPGTNATLTATATRADLDGDTITLDYVWKVNGTVRKTTSDSPSLTDTFDLSQAGNGDGGDTITVEVTPNDAVEDGSTANAIAVVSSPASAIFTDDFTSGGFTNWNAVTRLTIDNTTGSPATPSARAQVTGQSAFATKTLTGTFDQVCMSVAVNVTTQGGTAIDLLRLRTAANGPVSKVFLTASGVLSFRADVGATQQSSGTALGTGWHEIELCGTVGAAGTWDLYRDGVVIINDVVGNTGTTPVGLIQIGDNAARTMTVNFDHVRVDQSPGEGSPPPTDTTPPTVPGKPTGSSPAAGQITISWAASTDASPPITYRVYRDGGTSPVFTTQNTTFTDLGLTGGTSHFYEIDAQDSATPVNTSAKSLASDPILVQSGSSAIFTDDFTSGGFTNWNAVTRLTIDNTTGSPATPSARAQVTGQSAFATKTLTGTFDQVCMSVAVNVTTQGGTAIDLLRLRTAANGPVSKVFLTASGVLSFRADVGATQQSSGTALGTGWHEIELCGTVGAAGTWDLYRDGVVIINDVVGNTGTTPVGLIQIGDNAARTMTVNFDHVRVDQVAG